jgi:T-complex protein 1 subunit delta
MASGQASEGRQKANDEKGADVRMTNIIAAKAVADTVRTSLGPKGMDKMIQEPKGEVLISNDGATILAKMKLQHPTAKMMAELSKAQDIEAGDGTTSVVVIAGALLGAAQKLLTKGIHPQTITEAFLTAAGKAEEILEEVAVPVDLSNREQLLQSAITSLNSKVVSSSSDLLAPIAVDAVLKVIEPTTATNVDLSDVRLVKKLGATTDETEMVEGLVLTQKAARNAGGPTRVENAKVGLIQFCLSAPKTDMESNIQVRDYTQMDRLLREERTLLAKMVKQIAKTGCNVLLVQKSILRDAVTDLSLDFCAKAKIMVVRDVERDDIEFISKILGVEAAASLDTFTADKLATAGLVAEENLGSELGSIIRFTGLASKDQGRCVSVLVRASNQMLLDETERSIHDALCVVRSLVKKRFLIAGGSAPEMEVAQKLAGYARTVGGITAVCIEQYAEALELIPYTLAENAGLQPVEIVTQLRAAHAKGEKYAGINVKKCCVSDMYAENVVQPLLVSTSALNMATETVRMILKIDDIVLTRG